jgi:hypothetical protein
MGVEKTVARGGKTLAHGSVQISETVHHCLAGCRKDGKRVTRRSSDLAQLIPPRGVVGYDVMVHVGLQRFLEFRQREEIRTDLERQHGIALSSGAISNLGRRFLAYLEALHWQSATALGAALASDGGWPLHVDATGEGGRGTMVTAFTSWRHWVLGAWKIPTERSEFIQPAIERVAAAFGPPVAIMRDLGPAMIEATAGYVRSLETSIPVLACHQHFLADIGGDLLETSHNQMRDLFRQIKLLPQLRAFVRLHGRRLGESIGEGREALDRWLTESGTAQPIPDGVGGITTVRSLAQWVLDYHADGVGHGFPFDLPWLDLYCRCHHLALATGTFLSRPPADRNVRKALDKLHSLLRPVECDVPPFTSAGAILQKRADLFHRLRDVLRLEDKTPATARKLNDVRSAIDGLTDSLRTERPRRGPAKDTRQAIDLILDHLDRHGSHLWGHVIAMPDGGVRLVARTNNDLESFFHTIKQGERRRSGRKILTQDFEALPPAATLASNLRHADYVAIVCGSLDRLPEAFAQLDAADRSRSIATSTPVNPISAQTASLSTMDKRLVRRPVFEDRILATAQSG